MAPKRHIGDSQCSYLASGRSAPGGDGDTGQIITTITATATAAATASSSTTRAITKSFQASTDVASPPIGALVVSVTRFDKQQQ